MNEIIESVKNFLTSTGVYKLFYQVGENGEYIYNANWWQPLLMLAISGVLVYLAIAKKFEPLLLLPIAIGMLLTNLPGGGMFHLDLFIGESISFSEVLHHGGLLDLLYLGVKLGIYPCLIFIGIGAMTDFTPLISNPKSLLIGAGAQFGVFVAFSGALISGMFTGNEAAAIGIISVKIENMSLQHTELEAEGKAPDAAARVEEKPKKKNAIVAVCMGDGIEGIYRDLGCDYIIRGGQTQNPSTNDFIEAFRSVNAENIFVVPNNGNILMAAEQAGEMYEDANVIVLPSKNVGIGYAALAATDITAEPDEVKAQMEDAMSRVTAGYVSSAIRDTQIEGVNINNGDIMGIIGKEIVIVVDKQISAAVALADALLSRDGVFMLTAFVGEDVSEEEQAAVEERIRALHPAAEVYFAHGGQAIYPYIFVAE